MCVCVGGGLSHPDKVYSSHLRLGSCMGTRLNQYFLIILAIILRKLIRLHRNDFHYCLNNTSQNHGKLRSYTHIIRRNTHHKSAQQTNKNGVHRTRFVLIHFCILWTQEDHFPVISLCSLSIVCLTNTVGKELGTIDHGRDSRVFCPLLIQSLQ